MFLHADTVAVAIDKLQAISDFAQTEALPLAGCLGRTLAMEVMATENMPYFRRSVVDGYAVQSADVATATMDTPAVLTCKGYVPIGTFSSLTVGPGECAEIGTGGALPTGADAVVMMEYSEVLPDGRIALGQALKPGQQVVPIGDDFQQGTSLLQRGKVLSPYDLGLLATAGIGQASVYKQPRVSLLVTGSELVPPTAPVTAGKVRDANQTILSALATSLGYSVVHSQHLPDDHANIEVAIRHACTVSDLVLVSGGSSKGKADHNRQIIDRVTQGGVFTHGLGLKPGKPTILAHDATTHTVIAGLPGNPMSATVVFKLVFGELLQRLTHQLVPRPLPAVLTQTIHSDPGKRTLILCHLLPSPEGLGYLAEPISYRSAHVHTLSRADGYLLFDEKTYAQPAGATVWVYPL